MKNPALAFAGLVLATLGTAACDNSREAESKTPVAEAEVQTQLPESAVSDQTLQQTADQAAAQASTPAPGTTSATTTAPAGAYTTAPTQ